jgi:hypothetical protein
MNAFNQLFNRNNIQQNQAGSPTQSSPFSNVIDNLFGSGGGNNGGFLAGLLGGGGGGGGNYASNYSQVPGNNYASQSGLFSNQGGNYLATKYPNLFGAPGF